jgi:hypothetical protein
MNGAKVQCSSSDQSSGNKKIKQKTTNGLVVSQCEIVSFAVTDWFWGQKHRTAMRTGITLLPRFASAAAATPN